MLRTRPAAGLDGVVQSEVVLVEGAWILADLTGAPCQGLTLYSSVFHGILIRIFVNRVGPHGSGLHDRMILLGVSRTLLQYHRSQYYPYLQLIVVGVRIEDT